MSERGGGGGGGGGTGAGGGPLKYTINHDISWKTAEQMAEMLGTYIRTRAHNG